MENNEKKYKLYGSNKRDYYTKYNKGRIVLGKDINAAHKVVKALNSGKSIKEIFGDKEK